MSLHVEVHGSGFPVVVLHGAPTTPDHMRPLAERLGRRWRALLVHLPGYGKSASLLPYDLPRSHVLLEEALASLGVKQAAFVGLSGGSYRSFTLATRGNVRAVAIVGLGPVADFPPDEAAGLIAYGVPIRRGDALEPIIESVMVSAMTRKNPAWVADVRAWATATPREEMAQELAAFAHAPDLRPAIAKLDIPILLRVGDADLATPPVRARRIDAVAKRVSLEIVPGAGHALLCEDFDGTAASTERHIAQALAARS